MKRLAVSLIAVACLFILFTRWTHKSKDDRLQSNPSPHQQFQDKRSQTMFEDQEYTLLAMKHGVPIETAKSILADYDLALWGVNLLGSEKEELIFPEAMNTSEVVIAIGNKYSIPSATVASLLIDKQLLEERGEPEPIEEEPSDPNDY